MKHPDGTHLPNTKTRKEAEAVRIPLGGQVQSLNPL